MGQRMEERTQVFPKGLPVENVYELPKFFYYRLILDLFRTLHIITVTGTPGIGKSTFYGYFFEHYKSTHPNTTIIAASFTKKSVMKKVVVFREDGTVEESRESYAFIQAEHDAASDDVLYLYDDFKEFARRQKSTRKMLDDIPQYVWKV
uniref:Uncharacterized protein n=1 Tax=Phytophthora ramorum TaxID=164328 RepID=H3GSV3_PHYRM